MMECKVFSPESYWASRSIKKWVVYLSASKKKEIRYISAKDTNGAIRAAMAVSTLKGNLSCTARLATPKDLGARTIPARKGYNQFYTSNRVRGNNHDKC